MIHIQQSKTADSRTCDASKVTKEQLHASSVQHIRDVKKGLFLFCDMLLAASNIHDFDKLSSICHFHADFITKFKEHGWWDNHRKINRHHLLVDDGVPKDVNLIDVLEMIVDCVMAGMGRSGSVYPLDIKPDVLMAAFNNTVDLLKSKVVVNNEE